MLLRRKPWKMHQRNCSVPKNLHPPLESILAISFNLVHIMSRFMFSHCWEVHFPFYFKLHQLLHKIFYFINCWSEKANGGRICVQFETEAYSLVKLWFKLILTLHVNESFKLFFSTPNVLSVISSEFWSRGNSIKISVGWVLLIHHMFCSMYVCR